MLVPGIIKGNMHIKLECFLIELCVNAKKKFVQVICYSMTRIYMYTASQTFIPHLLYSFPVISVQYSTCILSAVSQQFSILSVFLSFFFPSNTTSTTNNTYLSAFVTRYTSLKSCLLYLRKNNKKNNKKNKKNKNKNKQLSDSLVTPI